tara:strand:+ start:761 stop:973 length:213 start_codon:yes stop_codon:yes gene_type:complete
MVIFQIFLKSGKKRVKNGGKTSKKRAEKTSKKSHIFMQKLLLFLLVFKGKNTKKHILKKPTEKINKKRHP